MARKVKMGRDDLLQLLEELGNELAKRFEKPVEVLVIGGAFLILVQGHRRNTEDLDLLPLNTGGWVGSLGTFTPSEAAQGVVKAIKAVARRNKLPPDWCNDASYSLNGGLDGFVSIRRHQLTLWGEFGMLRIYIPPLSYILACKIFANRPKDQEDIGHLLDELNVTNRKQAQAIMNQYVNLRWQYDYGVPQTLRELFPDG